MMQINYNWIPTDIMSHGFKVAVLGTSAVQLSWDYSEGWQHIMSYHIYYK